MALAPGCAFPGCTHLSPPVDPGEDPFDIITRVSFDNGGAGAVTEPLDASRYRWSGCACFLPSFPRRTAIRPSDKLHPRLAKWLLNHQARRETLLVTFRDTVRVPRFPRVDVRLPRSDPANQVTLAQIRARIRDFETRRSAQYSADSLDLATAFDARVIRKYWLVQALLVEMPLDKVDSLVSRPQVLFVQPLRGGEPPPQGGSYCDGSSPDNNSGNNVSEGRRQIASDAYLEAGLGYGWIALLDTGVRGSHIAFARSPSPLRLVNDMVPVEAPCGHPGAPDLCNHGTMSAAILTGEPVPDESFGGVTRATLDCLNVFDSACELDPDAAVRGIECAVAMGDPLIVAEMQNYGTPLAAVGQEADNAFALGHMIVAAAGNQGPQPLGVPADARGAIAVGAFKIDTGSQLAGQRYGTTADGRLKPEIQAPTGAETGCGNSDTSIGYHNGTSGATPFAAGAASLAANWLASAGSHDPGQAYAQLILAGRIEGPFRIDVAGAGPVQLPAHGDGRFGKVSLDRCWRKVEIPIPIASKDVVRLEAALWWPERAVVDAMGNLVDTHNDINLSLVDPAGNVVKASDGAPGVFERVTFAAGGARPDLAGEWKLRIEARTLNLAPQTVYWTAALLR
jgi:serine protease AprX